MDAPRDSDAFTIRVSTAEELYLIGEKVRKVRQAMTEDRLQRLMPLFMQQKFVQAISTAKVGIMQAMECMIDDEAVDTNEVARILVSRYHRMTDADKKVLIGFLREAFKSGGSK